MQDSQLSENAYKEDDNMNDGFQLIKGNKGKSKGGEPAEGVRRSSRLEAYEDVKVTNMSISRAKAKDAFIHKVNSSNPFSIMNTDSSTLIEIANSLRVELGSNDREIEVSVNLIKSLEMARSSLMQQSVSVNCKMIGPLKIRSPCH